MTTAKDMPKRAQIRFDTFIPLPPELQRKIGGDTDYESLDEVFSAFNSSGTSSRAFKVFDGIQKAVIVFNHDGSILVYKERFT